MDTFNTTQNIGDIVSIMPKAGEIFKEYNIDFCCGGNRPLSEAISSQKLNEEELLRKLHKAFEEAKKYEGQSDFKKMSRNELIDYIENIHHAYLKKVLPQLSELTTKILRVHGTSHSVLFRVHKLFHNLKMELDQHLIKEEEVLFPMIKDYDKKPSEILLDRVNQVMQETESEHDGAGDILKELRKITDDYMVPEDGCSTYSMTFRKLAELESDLFQHIHLENNILFRGINIQTESKKM